MSSAADSPPPREPLQTTPRYFRLTYSSAGLEDGPTLYKCRDAVAFDELTAGLPAKGFRYGTTIQFYPADERPATDLPAFRAGDLLVLTTRPPVHDGVTIAPPRKIIRRAKSVLEDAVFAELLKSFRFCTRKNVQLTGRAKARLRHDPDRWESLEFHEYSPTADILSHHVGPVEVPRPRLPTTTVAFLVRTTTMKGFPCSLLASFGLAGYTTLIWNRIVRVRYPEWIDRPGFVMAELIFRKPIPERPLTPEFADDPQHVEVHLLT
jgi:hypothetical protein